MRFTIGEFARILGVTTDTLRVYEKQGILTPQKDCTNNYRYYTDLDCRNILMSRWYRSLQIPLKEATKLTINSSVDEIKKTVLNRQSALKKEIQEQQKLLEKLNDINIEIDGIPNNLNTIKTRSASGLYRIQQTSQDDLIVDPLLKSLVERWMRLLPFTLFSFQIKKEVFLSDEEEFIYNWGLAIPEKDFVNFNLEMKQGIEYTAPHTCLTTVVEMVNDESLSKSSLRFILDTIKSKNLTVSGDVTGKIILKEKNTNGSYSSYLEVNIPVFI